MKPTEKERTCYFVQCTMQHSALESVLTSLSKVIIFFNFKNFILINFYV